MNGSACINQDNAASIGNCTIIVRVNTATSLATVFLDVWDEFLDLGLGQVGAGKVSVLLSGSHRNSLKTYYMRER